MDKIVSCSYSLSGSETCIISEALRGEYYIILITNYSDEDCNISFSQTGGSGTTDCSIVPSKAGSNSPVCHGDSLKLFVEEVDDANYFWEGPDDFSSTQQNPIIVDADPENSGLYSCTVSCGIESSTEITQVEVLQIPNAILSGDTTICKGGQASLNFNLSGKLPLMIEYSNEFDSFSIDCYRHDTVIYVSPSQSSYYAVNRVYNAYCYNDEPSFPVEVTVNDLIEVINLETVCNNTNDYYTVSFEITGGNPVNYNITPLLGVLTSEPPYIFVSDSIPTETPYNFTIEDESACEPLVINGVYSCSCSTTAYLSGDYSICEGEEAYLQVELSGTAPWNIIYTADGSSPQTVTIEETPYFLPVSPAINTLYGLIYVDDINCIGAASGLAMVIVNDSPSADFEYHIRCEDNTVSFTDRSSVPYGALRSWFWDFGDGTTSNQKNPEHYYTEPGNYRVSLSVESFIGCEHSISYDLRIYPELNVYAGDDINISYSSTTILHGMVTGGSGDFTTQWFPGDQVMNPLSLCTETKELIEHQSFILQSSDNETGCTQSDKVAVSVFGDPLSVSATVADPEICMGSYTRLNAMPEGGSGEYTYSWTSDPPGFVSELSNPIIEPGQTTTYFVVVSDGFSEVIEEESVVVNPVPHSCAGNQQELAYGATTQLTGNAMGGTQPYSFCWTPAALLVEHRVKDPITKPLTVSSVFQLQVTDANGCMHKDEVPVKVVGQPLNATIEINVQNSVCDNDTVELLASAVGGTNQYLYRWFNDDGITLSNSQILYVISEENTWCHLEIDDGYDSILLSHEVKVDPSPLINLIPDGYLETGQDTLEVCIYDTLLIEPLLNSYDYIWCDGSLELSRKMFTTGVGYDSQTIWITSIDPTSGCTSTDSLTVVFDFAECTGIIESQDSQDMLVYPNPSSGLVYYQSHNLPQNYSLTVMDMTGQKVIDQSITGFSNYDTGMLNLHHLKKGMYILRISGNRYQFIEKIVIR